MGPFNPIPRKMICVSPADLDAGFGQTGYLRKPFGVGYGDIGQHLAVDLDIGLLETEDELAVRQPVQARRGIDAGDPQAAEVALLDATVTEGVIERPVNRF